MIKIHHEQGEEYIWIVTLEHLDYGNWSLIIKAKLAIQ